MYGESVKLEAGAPRPRVGSLPLLQGDVLPPFSQISSSSPHILYKNPFDTEDSWSPLWQQGPEMSDESISVFPTVCHPVSAGQTSTKHLWLTKGSAEKIALALLRATGCMTAQGIAALPCRSTLPCPGDVRPDHVTYSWNVTGREHAPLEQKIKDCQLVLPCCHFLLP